MYVQNLLQGAHAGGNGFQPNGYSIIDENYLAAIALGPYEAEVAAALSTAVAYWLGKPRAAGWRRDRRENLWGVRTCAESPPPHLNHNLNLNGTTKSGLTECMVLGSYTPDPPLAGVNVADSPFAVYSELNNNHTFTVEFCARATGMTIRIIFGPD